MLLCKQINKDGHANKLGSSEFQKESEKANLLWSPNIYCSRFLAKSKKISHSVLTRSLNIKEQAGTHRNISNIMEQASTSRNIKEQGSTHRNIP